MIRSLEEAQSDLDHLLGRLHDRIKAALQEFLEEYGPRRFKLFGTAEASIIHSLITYFSSIRKL